MTSLNLTYADKMSMASSVEVRVPFLDRDFAEFVAWNVPPRLKLHGSIRPTTKYILRKAMAGTLPTEVLRQAKAGFGAPIDYWLAHELKPMVDELLSESRLKKPRHFSTRRSTLSGATTQKRQAGLVNADLAVADARDLDGTVH